MQKRAINPTKTGWAQANEVRDISRLLFISGQVPADHDGKVPEDPKAQCRLAWSNVNAQLDAAGLTLDNLVKVTIFLSHRRYIQDAYEVRTEVLGTSVVPAMTIVITGIYDEKWLLEIEGIAAE